MCAGEDLTPSTTVEVLVCAQKQALCGTDTSSGGLGLLPTVHLAQVQA